MKTFSSGIRASAVLSLTGLCAIRGVGCKGDVSIDPHLDGGVDRDSAAGRDDGDGDDGDDDDDGDSDATPDGSSDPIPDSEPDAAVSPKVQTQFPSTTIPAGEDIVYCYYFHFPSTEDVVVKSWQSSFGAGVKSIELFSTAADIQPAGTVSASQCGYGAAAIANSLPFLIYSSRTAQDGWSFPPDDGTGKPVGKPIKAGQPMYLRVHSINASTVQVQAQAQVSVTGYPTGTNVTRAESFSTYNGNLSIPPTGAVDTEMQTCSLPSDMQFTRLSIFTHKQGVHSYVRDGVGVAGTLVVDSPDWELPTTGVWNSSPFRTFTTGKLTYQCDYLNPTSRTITTGDSTQTDEICQAFGYYFPAAKSTLCYNGYSIP